MNRKYQPWQYAYAKICFYKDNWPENLSKEEEDKLLENLSFTHKEALESKAMFEAGIAWLQEQTTLPAKIVNRSCC